MQRLVVRFGRSASANHFCLSSSNFEFFSRRRAPIMNGDSGALDSYNERLEGFRKSDAERDALVAELIKNHAALQLKYDEKCEDYNNEVVSRRGWQSKFRTSEQALNQQKQVSVSLPAEGRAILHSPYSMVMEQYSKTFSTLKSKTVAPKPHTSSMLRSANNFKNFIRTATWHLRTSSLIPTSLQYLAELSALRSRTSTSSTSGLGRSVRIIKRLAVAPAYLAMLEFRAWTQLLQRSHHHLLLQALLRPRRKSFDVSSRPAPKKRYLLLNAYDERLDPDLPKADGRSWDRFTELTQARGRNFCNNHHLGDKCESGDYCEYLHGPKLTNGELLVLKNKALREYLLHLQVPVWRHAYCGFRACKAIDFLVCLRQQFVVWSISQCALASRCSSRALASRVVVERLVTSRTLRWM
ncbi:hypothetical protein KC325_g109 [Hortaea werneckii]|nr:hypothetical protein KC325_g109 [Hortaea werneckii]